MRTTKSITKLGTVLNYADRGKNLKDWPSRLSRGTQMSNGGGEQEVAAELRTRYLQFLQFLNEKPVFILSPRLILVFFRLLFDYVTRWTSAEDSWLCNDQASTSLSTNYKLRRFWSRTAWSGKTLTILKTVAVLFKDEGHCFYQSSDKRIINYCWIKRFVRREYFQLFLFNEYLNWSLNTTNVQDQ